MNSKQQCECCYCFFTARQLLNETEGLLRWHRGVVDTFQVRLLRVAARKTCGTALGVYAGTGEFLEEWQMQIKIWA